MVPSRQVVRPARDGDLMALQELARRTIDASYRPFLGDENVDAFVGSGASDEHVAGHLRRGQVLCLEAAGTIVGLAVVEGPTVDLLMVDVRRHREGLGTALLARVEELLFVQYESVRLETFVGNTAALAFYEACGWSVTSRTPSDSAMPDRLELVKHRPVDAT
ncbi:GNAT family N-acetyltransferase [Occultella kanbiaonis]|uniref:GNAT family N-acetyltransferase n=1 Tax=Occultella kanbiaonis TaxID=2675754 RepID=UPI001B354AD5|nr:GNAT family N-acetyltransferase [Occultella kanbiaonis]